MAAPQCPFLQTMGEAVLAARFHPGEAAGADHDLRACWLCKDSSPVVVQGEPGYLSIF
ncbi:MAG TPA: hypothetical protein VGF67_02395 [Ktedonobacteraceae bacterium]|jgi:hypothetical protein